MQPPLQLRDSPREPSLHHSVLPPLRQLSSTPPTPSAQRSGDPFRQILNPEQILVDQQPRRSRSVSQMDSPSPIDTPTSQSLPSISRPNSVNSTLDDPHHPRPFPPPGRHVARHKLDAKSPRLHRTPSLNLLNPPTGTIDAHQSPFLTATTRPLDPAISHPSLPTPPMAGRHSYFPPISTTAPLPPHTMARTEGGRPAIGFPPSGSASPIAQYSPYSQPGSAASSQYDPPTTPGHYQSRHASMTMHEPCRSASAAESERNMIPMAQSGQSSIQYITITSQQGRDVQIPVDVQAASKVADEKRRRNAGASARFRARRKEKEIEAAKAIARLQQELRDAREDAEFYRTERDFFRAALLQQPCPERVHARPTSPRLRRTSIPPSPTLNTPSSTQAGSEDSYAEYEDEAREGGRNVRRRTNSYHPASGPPPNAIGGPDSVPQAYPDSYSPAHASNSGQPSAQPCSAREQAHPRSQQQMSQERPVYHDPFGPDTNRLENGSWTPQGSHRQT